jgi:hypothetical protein
VIEMNTPHKFGVCRPLGRTPDATKKIRATTGVRIPTKKELESDD